MSFYTWYMNSQNNTNSNWLRSSDNRYNRGRQLNDNLINNIQRKTKKKRLCHIGMIQLLRGSNFLISQWPLPPNYGAQPHITLGRSHYCVWQQRDFYKHFYVKSSRYNIPRLSCSNSFLECRRTKGYCDYNRLRTGAIWKWAT